MYVHLRNAHTYTSPCLLVLYSITISTLYSFLSYLPSAALKHVLCKAEDYYFDNYRLSLLAT
jgi:hypothetical protein